MEPRADLSDNPFLKLENPYDGVKQKEGEIAQKAAEFQRLCYEVLHEFPAGRALWEQLRDMYLLNQQVDPTHPNSKELALWWDGFKACLLGLYNHGLQHIKRVNGV